MDNPTVSVQDHNYTYMFNFEQVTVDALLFHARLLSFWVEKKIGRKVSLWRVWRNDSLPNSDNCVREALARRRQNWSKAENFKKLRNFLGFLRFPVQAFLHLVSHLSAQQLQALLSSESTLSQNQTCLQFKKRRRQKSGIFLVQHKRKGCTMRIICALKGMNQFIKTDFMSSGIIDCIDHFITWNLSLANYSLKGSTSIHSFHTFCQFQFCTSGHKQKVPERTGSDREWSATFLKPPTSSESPAGPDLKSPVWLVGGLWQAAAFSYFGHRPQWVSKAGRMESRAAAQGRGTIGSHLSSSRSF